MIFNVGAGGATDADKIKYGESNVGATLDNLNESVDELNNSLTNENSETFNFGIKDGVRGFFTNPSRADDSFIPFNKTRKTQELVKDISTPSTVTFEFNDLTNFVGLNFYKKENAKFSRVKNFSISDNSMTLEYANDVGTYSGNVKCIGVESRENLTTVTKSITVKCLGYYYGYGILVFDELSEVVAVTSWSCTGVNAGNGDVGEIHFMGGNKLLVVYDNNGYSASADVTVNITVVGI